MTQITIKENIHKHRTQNFRTISPFGITPVEKAHKARTRWYRGPFRRRQRLVSRGCTGEGVETASVVKQVNR